MPDPSGQVSDSFRSSSGFVQRLLATFWRAFSYGPMAAALVCVLGAYTLGNLLDSVWLRAGAGVSAAADANAPVSIRSEVAAFACLDSDSGAAWREGARARQTALATIQAPATEKVAEQRTRINERLSRALTRIANDAKLSSGERAANRAELLRQADAMQFRLLASRHERFSEIEIDAAANAVLAGDGDADAKSLAADVAAYLEVARGCDAYAAKSRAAAIGPFWAFAEFQCQCIAAAANGLFSGRIVGGNAASPAPSLLGSVVSAGNGWVWLATQRPFFALVFGTLSLLLFSLFGGVICRIVAIDATRGELAEFGGAFTFIRERFASVTLAVGVPVGLCLVFALLLWLCGLFAAIPVIGPVLAGLAFFLSLIVAVALVFFLLLLVFGFPLMWPTIAVEGSDQFDALQRGAGYVFQRPGLYLFGQLVLLISGLFAFVVFRGVSAVVLKVAHCAMAAGASVWSSSETHSLSRIEAMWWMPAWQDLPLLPAPGSPPFWGIFGLAPLGTSETLGMYLLMFWVFMFAALTPAMLLAFFFAGSTELYLGLRKAVDGEDESEIFHEGELDDIDVPPPANAAESVPVVGTPLPVVSGPGKSG